MHNILKMQARLYIFFKILTYFGKQAAVFSPFHRNSASVSADKQYQKLFSYDDAELTFEPKALEAIADKAIERKIGARGLRAVMEGLLMNVMYDIPSDRTIDRVTITPGCVEGTEQPKISHRTEKEGEEPQPSLPADSAS